MTRPILYKGRWYSVPTSTRNDAYVKARDRGLSHDEACVSKAQNWARTLGRLRK